jgi:hypothetical protein
MVIVPYLETEFTECTFDYSFRTEIYMYHWTNYNYKYLVARSTAGEYIEKDIFINCRPKTLMLSKIFTKRGKSRYYLTMMTTYKCYVSCDCGNYRCDDPECMNMEEIAHFRSLYVGKYLQYAILRFMDSPTTYEPQPKQINRSNKVSSSYTDVCINQNEFNNWRLYYVM